MLTRRTLLKQGGGLLALSTVGNGQRGPALSDITRPAPRKQTALNAFTLEPFVDPLLVPQRIVPTSRESSKLHGVENAPFLSIAMRSSLRRMHRDLPPTFGYTYGRGAIGPLIDARQGEDLLIEWRNQLPARHFLPIDYSLQGSGREVPESRAIVHVHGGRTPALSDGYPDDAFPTGKSRLHHYPNRQAAATLWYHDHAMGVSRLNLYAGMMGMYLLRDEQEDHLNLPSGPHELPLMLCDRTFDHAGQLLYPVSGDPDHPWVDEVAGDAMVVNGRVQPFHVVEPRRYRLRIVNAANMRFFRLSLSTESNFHQIGSDQGFLPQPVEMRNLLLAPGERADLIVDFAASAGKNVTLKNGVFSLLQFRVASGQVQDNSELPKAFAPVTRLDEQASIKTRLHTLNEYDDPTGRSMVMLLNRLPWHMPVTETVKLDSIEIWSLVNLTEETHPIHLHHVRFQVLDRRPFDRDRFLLANGELQYQGDANAPMKHELGWKDVVQCPANTVTRIIIPFEGSRGRYAWHCHLLEHEANDMMRPYEII